MVLEIMEMKILPELELEFLRNAAQGVSIFREAKGCKGMEIRKSPDAPHEFRLLVRWETLENHIVDFRQSEGVVQWRKLIAHCFNGAPVIKNWTVAVEGYGIEI